MHDEIKDAGGDGLSDFWFKDISQSYAGPLNIAGELVDLDKQTPPLSESDREKRVHLPERLEDG
jgi:hypothetical protein